MNQCGSLLFWKIPVLQYFVGLGVTFLVSIHNLNLYMATFCLFCIVPCQHTFTFIFHGRHWQLENKSARTTSDPYVFILVSFDQRTGCYLSNLISQFVIAPPVSVTCSTLCFPVFPRCLTLNTNLLNCFPCPDQLTLFAPLVAQFVKVLFFINLYLFLSLSLILVTHLPSLEDFAISLSSEISIICDSYLHYELNVCQVTCRLKWGNSLDGGNFLLL